MTVTSSIISDVDAFIAAQNKNRGNSLAGGGTVPLDYDALTGSISSGGNAVTGISGIASSATTITLPARQAGNTVIIDGALSTTASTSGPDGYSLFVDASGVVTLTDNNTNNSQTISGANYLVFNGGATNSDGSFQNIEIIASGTNAQIAAMYNAALGRQPDLPGLEFYAIPTASGALSLHQDATFFIASPEFQKDYPALSAPTDNGGPNDQAFITELYGSILHRTPSTSEVNFYIQYMQGTLTGQTTPGNRADLLIFFSVSPENQKDISNWLINPTNGPVNFGQMSTQAVKAVLTNEIATGTINAADFSDMTADVVGVISSTGDVSINGQNYQLAPGPEIISTTAPNITIDLSSQYYFSGIQTSGMTINGASTGSCVIFLADSSSSSGQASSTVANYGGNINLAGNYNWLVSGTTAKANLSGASHTVSVATVVAGWSSTDLITAGVSPGFGTSAATLLANPNGLVLQGSATNPVNGASYTGTSTTASPFATTQFAVNVGTVTNDSVSAMVTAANAAYKVGDVFTNSGTYSLENAFFFGQDPQGNTMVYYWRGDTTHAGTILASDITGAMELVGIQASSLTSVNFHH